MDTFIKLIEEDNKIRCFAGSNFGYENLMFKIFDILIRNKNGETVHTSERSFFLINFKEIPYDEFREYETTIDAKNKKFYFHNGFQIHDLNKEKFSSVCDEDIGAVKRVYFDKADLMLKKEISFDEFKELYSFLKENFRFNSLIINDQYLYIPDVLR